MPCQGYRSSIPVTTLPRSLSMRSRPNSCSLFRATSSSSRRRSISKAENRYVELKDVRPSEQAQTLADQTGKDPRYVEVVLSESAEVVKHRPQCPDHGAPARLRDGQCRHRSIEYRACRRRGARAAAAARSRRFGGGAESRASMQRSALTSASSSMTVSAGPGATASSASRLGVAGLPSLLDMIGAPDLFGRPMQVTEIAVADEIAAGASLLMGQAAEGLPVVVVRGAEVRCGGASGIGAGAPARTGHVPMSAQQTTSLRGKPVVALCGGVGGAKLALGLERPDRRGPDRHRQHRRRFRASRPARLARHRHRALHARRAQRSRARLGTRGRKLEFHGGAGRARRRDLVPARRPRSCHACRAHPRAAQRHLVDRIHRGDRAPARHSGAHFADVGRSASRPW